MGNIFNVQTHTAGLYSVRSVTELLPENIAADADPRERTMTIRHVLTMQSGLQRDDEDEWKLAGCMEGRLFEFSDREVDRPHAIGVRTDPLYYPEPYCFHPQETDYFPCTAGSL